MYGLIWLKNKCSAERQTHMLCTPLCFGFFMRFHTYSYYKTIPYHVLLNTFLVNFPTNYKFSHFLTIYISWNKKISWIRKLNLPFWNWRTYLKSIMLDYIIAIFSTYSLPFFSGIITAESIVKLLITYSSFDLYENFYSSCDRRQ